MARYFHQPQFGTPAPTVRFAASGSVSTPGSGQGASPSGSVVSSSSLEHGGASSASSAVLFGKGAAKVLESPSSQVQASPGVQEETPMTKLLRATIKHTRRDSDDSESGQDSEAEESQPKRRKFKEASSTNRRLCVAKLSGVRGIAPKKILSTLDKLFRGHNGEDSYSSLVRGI